MKLLLAQAKRAKGELPPSGYSATPRLYSPSVCLPDLTNYADAAWLDGESLDERPWTRETGEGRVASTRVGASP